MASKTENRRINIWINGKEVENSGKAIRSEFNKARIALNNANKSASDYQDKLKRFKDAKRHLDKHNKELRGVSRSWMNFKTVMGGVLGAGLIQGIMSRGARMAKSLVRNAAKLSDAYADVQKFTGLTRQAVAELDQEFQAFNTRTPREELLNLAKVAGRIGIEGKQNIKDFVEQANQINVALGEDLGEDAVLQIGKIASAFEADMLQIGSAINSAGQNSKAQEQYLVDFTARMQGTGVTAGIAAGDIIGYGAVLDSLGQRVEMSGTALNNFFIDFVKDSEKFGEAAGFANGELSKMIGEKGTNEGFIAFMEALKEANPEKDKFLKKLETLGINGARGAQVFLALSNNLDEVRRMQELSTDAFEKGSSVTDEYNIRNENLAASLEKIQNWLTRLFVNDTTIAWAERWVNIFADWVEVPVSDTLKQEVVDLRALELQIYDTNTPAEERVKLIKKLQEEYPNYLGNLDAETVSNDELRSSIGKLNDQLIYKLQLQIKEEQIKKRVAAMDANNKKLAAMDLEMIEKIAEAERKYGLEINESLSTLEKSAQVRQQMKDKNIEGSLADFFFGNEADSLEDLERNYKTIEEFTKGTQAKLLKELEEEKMAIYERQKQANMANGPVDPIGAIVNEDEDDDTTTTGGGGGTKELSDAQKKALEKKREAFLKAEADLRKALDDIRVQNIAEEEQRAIDQAALDYQRKQEEIAASVASEATKNALLAEEKIAFENRIDQITAEFEEKRKADETAKAEQEAAEKQMLDEALLTQRELELQEVQSHYDQLIALAEKHGADTTALEAKRRQEISAINDHYNQIDRQKQLDALMAQFENAREFTSATTGTMMAIMNLMGASAEQMNDFQKASALFQIGIDLAQGLAAAAQNAASDPKNAITSGASGIATFATITGMLLPAIAQAKSILGKEKQPKYSAVSAPRYRRGMRFSGVSHDSGYGGNPIMDPRDGSILGTIERNETLLSEATRANNGAVVDALLQSSMRGGEEVDLLPYAMAQNQAEMDFDGLGGVSGAGGGMAKEDIAAMVAEAMAPALGEIRRIKEQPSVVKLSQLKDAQRELDAVQALSGKKMN